MFDQNSLASAVERSNLSEVSQPKDLQEIFSTAVNFVPDHSDNLLEFSVMGLHRTADGHRLGADYPCYLFLFPSHFVVVKEVGFVRRKLEPVGREYDSYFRLAAEAQVVEDGKIGEFAIQIYGSPDVPLGRLAWHWRRPNFSTDASASQLSAARERDRIHAALNRVRGGQ